MVEATEERRHIALLVRQAAEQAPALRGSMCLHQFTAECEGLVQTSRAAHLDDPDKLRVDFPCRRFGGGDAEGRKIQVVDVRLPKRSPFAGEI